ncbi:Ni,Fe-hydrogenase I small subunit [Metallosphaera yellowstonensis MK1]|jgi:hydrogenase small subunit|uniref:Ni,Fe-hydrogenase I small subunit n=1 Tax=Metallosphaera yellowstonensis MK1 TaxID=671065 RepID=H2C1C6_9CREN|nr:hydrogenase [Metallosphaera yellowstonensis]EHP70047.1 Ni,Fe-hydrogenase I small subunit [Metallosphaera yellowstonensis MK1]
MRNLLWLQGGACGGNTLSMLNASDPDVLEFLHQHEARFLWHPSLSPECGGDLKRLLNSILEARLELHVFLFEGSVITGPNGTGQYNMFAGKPMMHWVREIAKRAKYVVAVGDCASFGGIPAADPNPTQSTGLQYHRKEAGGFLGKDFRSSSGLPVINLSGCPVHPEWLFTTLSMILEERITQGDLDDFNRPKIFYSTTTQFGCPRQPYFTFKIASKELGHREGCLYFELGCRGSYTRSPCNNILWNNQSSKTRVGTPCMGCTEFDFPTFNFFRTEKNRSGIPKRLPLGVSRGSYITLSAIARGAAPQYLVRPLIKREGNWIE